MSNATSSTPARPQGASSKDASEAPSKGRAVYEAPRIERRIPVARHTLQGPQTSGSESFFGP